MIDSLQALKADIERHPNTDDDNRFGETLWQLINSVKTTAEAEQVTSDPRFPALADFFKHYWAGYFWHKEQSFASSIVQPNAKADSAERARHAAHFAGLCPPASINAYRAVYDGDTTEQELISLKDRQGTFTIVGCGAYPTSFVSFYTHASSYSHYVAIDSDPDSLLLGKNIFALYADSAGRGHVSFQCAKAEEFDYSHTNVLLITLGLFNRKTVLERAATELSSGSFVILRNPILLGSLVYEDVLAHVAPLGFTILANTAITTHCMSFLLKKP